MNLNPHTMTEYPEPSLKRSIYKEEVIDSNKMIGLFNRTFQESEQTILIGGGHEPEYLPADRIEGYHRIIFSFDYVASALHEIAHWCIAGKQRRLKQDYGYWYVPDGRNPRQQAVFEDVEVKPQALEWIFSNACGLKFKISVDNINAGEQCDRPSTEFKQRIVSQAQLYCQSGLSQRAHQWIHVLTQTHQCSSPLDSSRYCLGELK